MGKLLLRVAIKFQNEKKLLFLCNRNVLAKGIYKLLIKQKEDAVLLIGNTTEWDMNARILVAGFKGGVGLNDPKLTMAIIASDTKDVRQYEGRIRTTNNIIYHFVDNYEPFENHWNSCQKWYLAKGATIKILGVKHKFPDKKTKSSFPQQELLK